MNGHTHGPWRLAPSANDGGFITSDTGGVASVHVRENRLEHVGNAFLIAAAPDLLAAIKALLAHYVQLVESGDAGNWNAEHEPKVIAARDAIAKAEGL